MATRPPGSSRCRTQRPPQIEALESRLLLHGTAAYAFAPPAAGWAQLAPEAPRAPAAVVRLPAEASPLGRSAPGGYDARPAVIWVVQEEMFLGGGGVTFRLTVDFWGGLLPREQSGFAGLTDPAAPAGSLLHAEAPGALRSAPADPAARLLLAPRAEAALHPLLKTSEVSTNGATPAVVDLAAAAQPGRQAPAAGDPLAGGPSWPRATLSAGPVVLGADRQAAAGAPPAALPGGGGGGDGLLTPQPRDPAGAAGPDHPAPLARPQQSADPPGDFSQDPGEASAEQPPPPPEAADLVTGGLSVGLAALGRALRAVTAPDSAGGPAGGGAVLLRWLAVSSWVLGGAAAYVAATRRRLPRPALFGGELALDEEAP